jgi:hypothetical protein
MLFSAALIIDCGRLHRYDFMLAEAFADKVKAR